MTSTNRKNAANTSTPAYALDYVRFSFTNVVFQKAIDIILKNVTPIVELQKAETVWPT